MLKKIKNPIIATLLSFNRIDYKKDINMKSGVDRFLDKTAFSLTGNYNFKLYYLSVSLRISNIRVTFHMRQIISNTTFIKE